MYSSNMTYLLECSNKMDLISYLVSSLLQLSESNDLPGGEERLKEKQKSMRSKLDDFRGFCPMSLLS